MVLVGRCSRCFLDKSLSAAASAAEVAGVQVKALPSGVWVYDDVYHGVYHLYCYIVCHGGLPAYYPGNSLPVFERNHPGFPGKQPVQRADRMMGDLWPGAGQYAVSWIKAEKGPDGPLKTCSLLRPTVDGAVSSLSNYRPSAVFPVLYFVCCLLLFNLLDNRRTVNSAGQDRSGDNGNSTRQGVLPLHSAGDVLFDGLDTDGQNGYCAEGIVLADCDLVGVLESSTEFLKGTP